MRSMSVQAHGSNGAPLGADGRARSAVAAAGGLRARLLHGDNDASENDSDSDSDGGGPAAASARAESSTTSSTAAALLLPRWLAGPIRVAASTIHGTVSGRVVMVFLLLDCLLLIGENICGVVYIENSALLSPALQRSCQTHSSASYAITTAATNVYGLMCALWVRHMRKWPGALSPSDTRLSLRARRRASSGAAHPAGMAVPMRRSQVPRALRWTLVGVPAGALLMITVNLVVETAYAVHQFADTKDATTFDALQTLTDMVAENISIMVLMLGVAELYLDLAGLHHLVLSVADSWSATFATAVDASTAVDVRALRAQHDVLVRTFRAASREHSRVLVWAGLYITTGTAFELLQALLGRLNVYGTIRFEMVGIFGAILLGVTMHVMAVTNDSYKALSRAVASGVTGGAIGAARRVGAGSDHLDGDPGGGDGSTLTASLRNALGAGHGESDTGRGASDASKSAARASRVGAIHGGSSALSDAGDAGKARHDGGSDVRMMSLHYAESRAMSDFVDRHATRLAFRVGGVAITHSMVAGVTRSVMTSLVALIVKQAIANQIQ